MLMDPNKKEREDEEKLRQEVKAAKKHWRRIRKQRFGFLDNTAGGGTPSVGATTTDEKKVEDL